MQEYELTVLIHPDRESELEKALTTVRELVTTNGGPGTQSTNLTYLVYVQALLQFDIGGASAGGIVAVILANIVAIFLVRLVGKNLEA